MIMQLGNKQEVFEQIFVKTASKLRKNNKM